MPVTLVPVGVRGDDLDQVEPPRLEHQIALDRQRADRGAGRERAAIVDRGVADGAVAAERAAGVDGQAELAIEPSTTSVPAATVVAPLIWPAPGSEDTELGVILEPEVVYGTQTLCTRVQA